MTALNILLEPTRVCIAADTLVSRDGRPSMLLSKIFLLPHLNMAMCGTGDMALILEWYARLQTGILALDLAHLNVCAQAELARLGRKHHARPDAPTTIYHLGLDGREQRFHGFVYRSGDGFAPRPLPHGWGCSPPVEGPPPRDLPADVVALMLRQKREDEALPVEERAGIGGDIHLLLMTPGEYKLYHCHRFADYAADYAAIVGRIEAENRRRG